MAVAGTAAGEAQDLPAPQQQQQQQQGFMDFVLQSLTYFFLFNILLNAGQWMARQTYAKDMMKPNATVISGSSESTAAAPNVGTPKWQHPNYHNLLWPQGSQLTLEVFLTEDTECRDSRESGAAAVLAHWMEHNIIFSPKQHESNRRNATFPIPISQNMRNNRTRILAHIYLKQNPIDDTLLQSSANTVLYKCLNMTKFQTRKKDLKVERSLMEDPNLVTASKNLDNILNLDPSDDSVLATAARKTTEDVTLLYVKPTLTLHLVEDTPLSFKKSSIPTPISKHMDFVHPQEHDADTQHASDYFPIFYPSEFWMRHQDTFPVNGTLSNVTLTLYLQPIRMWKWQLMSQMEESWRIQDEQGGAGGGGADLIRTLLMDTNPWLLAITAIVSLLHSAFDILAFKNDINFFKGKKSMEGLSLKSMVINTFFQVIIFLYLLDNSTNTSYMVIMSNAFGLLIEFWKISKAFTISFANNNTTNKNTGWITWEETSTYKNSKTKEYDEIATSHLLYVSMPLVAGYGVYSLFHQKHKGWYSWIINTMVGFIYMFGFVMMTPQLFINYKLKSVAHMNWRTMTYKSINTFIDDLFAFVIKMPLMHRLACLRDDLIFFIFLYQRWIYRVDYTRVNEFGQCAISPAEQEQGNQSMSATIPSLQNDNPSADTTTHDKCVTKDPVAVKSSSEQTTTTTTTTTRRRGAKEK